MSKTTLTLMLITNDPPFAQHAVAAGVDRIFIDLEQLDKAVRQQGYSTVISSHSVNDITAMRQALPDAEILVRTNPPHDGLAAEVEEAVQRGADVLMLPMFTHPDQVSQFIEYVRGRARICLLLETPQAVVRLPRILALADDIHEIHVGLNDLHLGLGLKFMFESVAGGLVDSIAQQTIRAGLRFGFGGVARLGEGAVPAELVLSEHIRLNSSLVILSRSFHQGIKQTLSSEVQKLRAEEARLRRLSPAELLSNQIEFNRRVWSVAGCQ